MMMFLPRGRRGVIHELCRIPGHRRVHHLEPASDPRAGVAIGDHAADSHLHSRYGVMQRGVDHPLSNPNNVGVPT